MDGDGTHTALRTCTSPYQCSVTVRGPPRSSAQALELACLGTNPSIATYKPHAIGQLLLLIIKPVLQFPGLHTGVTEHLPSGASVVMNGSKQAECPEQWLHTVLCMFRLQPSPPHGQCLLQGCFNCPNLEHLPAEAGSLLSNQGLKVKCLSGVGGVALRTGHVYNTEGSHSGPASCGRTGCISLLSRRPEIEILVSNILIFKHWQ